MGHDGLHVQARHPQGDRPSELGLSLQVLASPDVLTTDGTSQSQITVTARGPNSEPKAGVPLRADIRVGGSDRRPRALSSKSASTGADGRVTFTYTAPVGGLAGQPRLQQHRPARRSRR